MKKFEKLLESSANADHPDFQALLDAFLKQKKTAENGRELRRKKKEAFEAAAADEKAAAEAVFLLEMEAEKERLRQKIRRVDLQIAEFLLNNWLEGEGRSIKKITKAAEKSAAKTASEKVGKTKKTPQKVVEKSAEKAAEEAAEKPVLKKAAPVKPASTARVSKKTAPKKP